MLSKHPQLRELELKNRLLQLESPFTWKMPTLDHHVDTFIRHQTEKCENVEEFEFQWTSFIVHIVLAYELCVKLKDFTKAEEHINTVEAHLHSLTRQICTEELLTAIKSALWHVALATKAHVLFNKGDTDGLDQVIAGIKQLHEMSQVEKAGMLGIKAGICIQYGTEGHRLALKFATKARDLDPDQAEWHFLVGNAMGRLRRTEYSQISAEEVAALEKAFALQRNAAYTVHLAQLYADYANELFFNAYKSDSKTNLEKAKSFSKKAIARFKEALELRPDCASLMARVAHGLIRMRDKDVLDISYTKELLDRAVSMSPSSAMVYHDLGLYYEKFEGNTKKAIDNLQKSTDLGNVKAIFYMIIVKWNHGMKNQIIGDLKREFDHHKTTEGQTELMTSLGVAHILIENDWSSGIACLTRSLEMDSSAIYLQRYHGFGSRKINLLELITNELRLRPVGSLADQKSTQRFLDLSKSAQPEIFSTSPIPGKFDEWKRELLRKECKNSKNQKKRQIFVVK